MLKIKLLPVAISSTDSTFTVPCCSTMTMKFIELGNVRVDAPAFSFDKLCVGKFLLNANVFHWCHMGHGRDKKASKTCSTSELWSLILQIFLGKGHFLTDLSNQVFWKKVLFMSAKWHRPSLRGHDSVIMRHTNIFEQTCPFEWDGSLDNFQGPRCFLPAFSAFIKVRNCGLGLHVDQIAEMVCIWDHISHKVPFSRMVKKGSKFGQKILKFLTMMKSQVRSRLQNSKFSIAITEKCVRLKIHIF